MDILQMMHEDFVIELKVVKAFQNHDKNFEPGEKYKFNREDAEFLHGLDLVSGVGRILKNRVGKVGKVALDEFFGKPAGHKLDLFKLKEDPSLAGETNLDTDTLDEIEGLFDE